MCLWQRFLLIILYLILIIVSSWILEWFMLYETGYTSYQIVEPLRNLSVSQLQALLNSRGIHHANLLEKSEIVETLQYSGNVRYLELLGALNLPQSSGPNEIVGKDEFQEQVLEEIESIWVIEIVPRDEIYKGKRILDEKSWKEIDGYLKVVGINTAVIHCHKDPSLCSQQGWSFPQLVMTVPKPDSDSKWDIKLHSDSRLSSNFVMSWIRKELSKLIKRIEAPEELQYESLNTTLVKDTQIPQMVYFTNLLNPPLLLMAFGLRFSSRMRFSIFNVRGLDKDVVSKSINTHKLGNHPSLVVTSGNSISHYGDKKGEYLTTSALDVYVRLLQPTLDDIFLLSLIVTNFVGLVDVIDVRGSLWKHFIRTMFTFPIYNILVFVSWLTITAILKFSWLKPIISIGSRLIHDLEFSGISEVLLYYVVIIEHFRRIPVFALVLFVLFVYIWRRIMKRPIQAGPDQDGENWYTVFPMDSYLVNVLFRPMASLSRPRPSHDIDLEEGMERLIQRLATPDLWLHPMLPTEYMKDLPSWRYDGWGNEDDLKSESETDFDSLSETENESLLETHVCCQDDGCKMCTLWATVKETYVCHRCAILKRKLEKKYLRARNKGEATSVTYEKLLKVCDNCARTKKGQSNNTSSRSGYNSQQKSRRQWLITAQKLNELKWSAPLYAIESRVCAICLDKYRWSAVLCGLPCGHTYHHSCIMEWLSKDNHQCPTCRWPSYKTKVDPS